MVSIQKDKNGYLIVRVNTTNYRLNRLLLEYKIKRKLKSNEVSHHIDGNILNNNFDNLEVKTKRKHQIEHQRLRAIKNYHKYYLCKCGNRKSFQAKICMNCYIKKTKKYKRNNQGRFIKQMKGGIK